ncbi:hypothetical protein C1646_777685 [Rhizophagus diaphanus]|nr:hypothetical protein C1646_777685 [Rhizophagus diaphanus] [Rhizophagus sp. MUCL 43196]
MYTSTISNQTDRIGTAPTLCYDGTRPLIGIPYMFQDLGLHRNDIVAEFDNGMTAILQQSLSDKQTIHFMLTEVSDDTKYVNGLSTYILCITVPEEMSLSMFKTKIVRIVSNILNSTSKFGIETISVYPLQGYHTEKKL